MFFPCNTILINWFPLQHYSKILILLFVRGSPITQGYPAVNSSLQKSFNAQTFSEKFHILINNLHIVASNSSLWFIGFFGNGACYNVAGIWGGPYLKEVFGYGSVNVSNALLSLSIGRCVGFLLDPYLSILICCKLKKLTSFICTIVDILYWVPLVFFFFS